MTVSRFRYLFSRYASGQCTPEEQQEFMLLVEQAEHDEELKQLLDNLLLGDDDLGTMPDDVAANMLQQIMQTQPTVTRARVMPVWKRAAIAAGILGAISIAGYKLYNKSSADHMPMASSHPAPAKNQHARLVLGDNSVIDLEKDDTSTLAVQTGVSINRQGNLLSYNSTHSIHPTVNTIYTNKGGTYQVILPDGTKAWLNAASSIRFPTAFTDSTREVTIQGEVYFEIAAQANQPFIVKTNTMKIAVLGTHFNVMAYEEENNICTSLLEGAVNILSGTSVKRLLPGQQALVNREHAGISISNADVNNAIAWKEGRFEFNGNIQAIMRELARWYDIQVVYEGSVTDRAFAASFSRQEGLPEILQQLELTGSIHFNIAGNTVTVGP
ncbi:MAG: FecR domain-containing protein [Chitinophaga sp.]|uniref:FecR family protein n=1 Tax=Chitinophaga sp. TaxID=1869181 RepID=UPI001B2052F9|nr:FecR family protein [Chitinophaga sp.]MBO9731522.1 FecR domain-containing protein [Chitinophaga sp.]